MTNIVTNVISTTYIFLRQTPRASSHFAFSSVRARLLLLVLMVIIPSLGLIIYIAREERLQGFDRARESTLKLVREATIQQQRSINQTRDFLMELSQYPELDHPKAKACPALLAKKLNDHPEYTNVFVVTLDGELVCSALPFAGRLNVSDRAYFQLTVARKSFSVGEYQIGRVTGKATLTFGHPVLDETGKFAAVLAASLDLTHLSDLVKEATLPKGSAMLLIDSNGTVLVHHPDPPAWRRAGPQRIVGKSMTDQPLVQRLLAAKREEVGQEVGLDGVHRLYAFAPIRVGGDTRAYLGMGIPVEVAFADAERALRRNLILLGLVSLLAFGAAWFGGDYFILRRVDNLVSATRRLASGDLSARTAMPYEDSELGQLARAFDGMADSLKKRQAEIDQAQRAIHYSDQRIRMMVEAVQDYAIIMLDPDGYVVSWNSGAARIKGYQAKEIIGKHFACFYPPEDIEHGKPEHGLEIASSEGRFEYDGWRLRKDGSRFWANVIITPVHDDRGQLIAYSKVTHDLTERKRAEDALRAQNMELQILHETSQTILASPNIQNMAASILEKALAVSLCDVGVIRLLDRTSRTLDPIASHGYVKPKNLLQHRRHLEDGTTGRLLRIFARKETVVSERVQDEPGLRTFKREGVQSLILIPVIAEHDLLGALQLGSLTPRKFDSHVINLLETLGSNFGIAVQKNRLLKETLASQAQLRALSRRLVKTQERERRYLARELHDEIGSLLTGLKLTLGGSAGPGTDRIDARTAAAHAIIDEALVKTRSLSHSLRPPMLDDLGLLSALSWHIKEFTARANVQVNFQHHDLQGRFPEEVEIAAYRIVQEALTNIARHAQVHEATVTLWADQSGLGIEISDQGAGFDQTATLANASGVGLAGMRERVVSLGGNLTITSAPGTGTSVTVELPLATGEKTVRCEQ